MDRGSKVTLAFRAGTLLVAVGLAFGLVSYTSSLTVTGYHGDTYLCGFNCQYSPSAVAPAHTYQVLAGLEYLSPQQMYFLNMTSAPVDAQVFLLRTNVTAFYVWIAGKSGVPLSNISSGGPQPLIWFSDYVALHGHEVVAQYQVSQSFKVVRYLVNDFEPVMVVMTNGNTQPLNFTSFETSVNLTINPGPGFLVTGCLFGPGIVLIVAGLALKRKPR